MTIESPYAVRLAFAYRCRRATASLAVAYLARPELRVRTLECRGLVVDEGWIPSRAADSFMTLLHVVAGTVVLRGKRTTVRLGAGATLLAPQAYVATARFERARVLEVSWATSSIEHPRLVAATPALAQLAVEMQQVVQGRSSERAYFAKVVDVVTGLGIELPDAACRVEGGPSERDLRLGLALAEQFADLKRKGSISHLSDDASISPRQLHRTLRAFSQRYGIDAGGWRDVRNRWRLRLAIALLSLPQLSVREVADEVGLSSSTCLARFFAQCAVPSPKVVRAQSLHSLLQWEIEHVPSVSSSVLTDEYFVTQPCAQEALPLQSPRHVCARKQSGFVPHAARSAAQ